MRTKIAVKNLQPGMRVVNTGLSWIEHPYLYSTPGIIQSAAQVASLVEEGYTEVFVDADTVPRPDGSRQLSVEEEISKAMDLEALAKTEGRVPAADTVPLQEELEQARRIHDDSLKLVKDCMHDIRMGKQIDYAASEELVEDVIGSVMRNSNALFSLTKLRSCDEYTYTHSINVSVLTLAFAKHLNFPETMLHNLGLAALFHDMGKARIPDAILNKPGKLTDNEFAIIKEHPTRGVDLLIESNAAGEDVLRGVAEHHEKYSGKGYPNGLAAEDISLFGSVISLADVYDALTSQRVYKKGIQPNKAMGTIYSMRGQDFFPEHVVHFVRFLGIYPIGSIVQLSTGEFALVVSPNPGSPLFPNIKVIMDRDRKPCLPRDIDLAAHVADDGGLKIEHSFDPQEFGVDPALHLL